MLISRASQKQKTVALSSSEAEYVAATAAACQGMWLNLLVSELSWIDERMVKLLVDNKSAIVLTKNPVQHSRMKHIDTRHHFILQYVEDKKIQVDYVRTENQLDDILTKSLGRVKLLEMCERLGIVKVCMEELSQGGECWVVSAWCFCPADRYFLEYNTQALRKRQVYSCQALLVTSSSCVICCHI